MYLWDSSSEYIIVYEGYCVLNMIKINKLGGV